MAREFNTFLLKVLRKLKISYPLSHLTCLNWLILLKLKNLRMLNFPFRLELVLMSLRSLWRIIPINLLTWTKSALVFLLLLHLLLLRILPELTTCSFLQASFHRVGKQPQSHPYSRVVLNVIHATIALSRSCLSCPRSSSVIYTTYYINFSMKII